MTTLDELQIDPRWLAPTLPQGVWFTEIFSNSESLRLVESGHLLLVSAPYTITSTYDKAIYASFELTEYPGGLWLKAIQGSFSAVALTDRGTVEINLRFADGICQRVEVWDDRRSTGQPPLLGQ